MRSIVTIMCIKKKLFSMYLPTNGSDPKGAKGISWSTSHVSTETWLQCGIKFLSLACFVAAELWRAYSCDVVT